MKDEPRPAATKHQLEHAVPTVIHDPEADMPLLERWLRRAMANPTQFWGLVGASVLVLAVLAVLGSGISLGKVQSDEAWTKLEAAKTPGERVDIADEFPKTPASHWARLQAATEYYNQGFADLPSNRDAAMAQLRKAQDLFEKVANEAPRDIPLSRTAALGLARTLEARNDIDKAIKQYEAVASSWPDKEDGKQARQRVEELKKPESVAFYKKLHEFKPFTATLPPGGASSLSLPPGHPAIPGAADTSGVPPLLLPPAPAKAEAGTEKGKDGMPPPVFLPPPPAPSPKNAAEAPATPKGELPKDVFAPSQPKP